MKKTEDSGKRSGSTQEPEDVYSRIFCCMINQSDLPAVPRNIPYEKHFDLAVIYYIQPEENSDRPRITLTNQIVQYLELTIEEMKKIAWKNTMTKKHAILRPLPFFLGEAQEEDPPLYVLTNEDMSLGAVTILYPGLLDLIAEKLDSDLCILPSSIHECLLLPADKETDWEGLRKIVQKVNDTEVDDAEILSYNIYRYSRREKALSIDNS